MSDQTQQDGESQKGGAGQGGVGQQDGASQGVAGQQGVVGGQGGASPAPTFACYWLLVIDYPDIWRQVWASPASES